MRPAACSIPVIAVIECMSVCLSVILAHNRPVDVADQLLYAYIANMEVYI